MFNTEGGKALVAGTEAGACPALTSLNFKSECCVVCVCVVRTRCWCLQWEHQQGVLHV